MLCFNVKSALSLVQGWIRALEFISIACPKNRKLNDRILSSDLYTSLSNLLNSDAHEKASK